MFTWCKKKSDTFYNKTDVYQTSSCGLSLLRCLLLATRGRYWLLTQGTSVFHSLMDSLIINGFLDYNFQGSSPNITIPQHQSTRKHIAREATHRNTWSTQNIQVSKINATGFIQSFIKKKYSLLDATFLQMYRTYRRRW